MITRGFIWWHDAASLIVIFIRDRDQGLRMIGFMRFLLWSVKQRRQTPPEVPHDRTPVQSYCCVAFASLQPSFAAPIPNRYKDLVPAYNNA